MELRIRVGAALDANVAGLFRPLEAQAKKARATIEAELNAGGRRGVEGIRAELAKAGKEFDKVGDSAARAAKVIDSSLAGAVRRASTDARGLGDAYEREAKRAGSAMERHVVRVGRGAMQSLGATYNRTQAVARDVARGAGVDLDVGSIVGRRVELQRRAIDLTNAGYMPLSTLRAGEKPGENNVRKSPGELIQQAQEVGNLAAFDPTKVLEGLQAYVGKTGDLKTGRDLLADMAVLARSSGTGLEDMIDAAGDVANALGETDNKGQKVSAIMRTIAGQGKIGAVEIKNLATQMAKLGAAAGAFEGDPTENLGYMGALAQMSRARGGSASATQAATSVASLVSLLKTPARIQAFRNEGVEVLNQRTGQMRNVRDIVLESLKATEGDPERFKKMFANVQGARAVEGFATVYREQRAGVLAKGGSDKAASEAGLRAVEAEFDRFRKIAMGGGEIQESFRRSMEGTDAKVQLFNNRLGEIASRAGEKLLPALEKLEPGILKAAEGLVKLVDFAVENPGEVITAAIVASIGKAMLGVAVRGAIEAGVRGMLGGGGAGAASLLGGGGGALGGGGGMLGRLGAGGLGLGTVGAGVIGGTLAAGVGLWAWSSAKTDQRMLEERQAAARQAQTIVDAPRQKVNAALMASGIDVDPTAGLNPNDIRRFAATQDEADKLEAIAAARQAMGLKEAAPVAGGVLGVSPELAQRLVASVPGGQSVQPTQASQATAGAAAAAPPELRDMLAVLQRQTGTLERIAANTSGGGGPPPPAGGARMLPSGEITFGTPPPL